MRRALAVLLTAFRIGWQNESNWTWRPLYFLYVLIRPMAACMILYFLFRVVSSNPAANPGFVSVYICNAFFTIFVAMTGGIGWVIIEDREWFQVIKYVYIAPMNFILYLIGRMLLVLLISIFGLTVILLFGEFVLGIPLAAGSIHWPLLAASFILGMISSAALGVMLAALVLITARHSMLLSEGIGGVFLLLCGIIYPIDFMPRILREVSLGIPLTWWMETTRRAFSRPAFGKMLASYSTGEALLIFLATAAILMVASSLSFRLCMGYAKKNGKIDQMTNY